MSPIRFTRPSSSAGVSPANATAIHVPPCFGLGCNLHGSCLNYARIEGGDPFETRMSECGPEHSQYIAVVPA
jgi:hypothetical protein